MEMFGHGSRASPKRPSQNPRSWEFRNSPESNPLRSLLLFRADAAGEFRQRGENVLIPVFALEDHVPPETVSARHRHDINLHKPQEGGQASLLPLYSSVPQFQRYATGVLFTYPKKDFSLSRKLSFSLTETSISWARAWRSVLWRSVKSRGTSTER
jgi:hypothetical protein